MNSNTIKTIVYFIIIIFVIVFLIYFYKNLAVGSLDQEISSEITTPRSKNTVIQQNINLELFEKDKFINLKKSDSESSVFQAGRRNPFKPYNTK